MDLKKEKEMGSGRYFGSKLQPLKERVESLESSGDLSTEEEEKVMGEDRGDK